MHIPGHCEKILRVALDIPLPKTFDYLADDDRDWQIGSCVRVPFGPHEKTGVVVAVDPPDCHDRKKLRLISASQTNLPPLPKEWLALTEFASTYYHHPLGEAIATALPPGLKRVGLARNPDPVLQLTLEGRNWLAKRASSARSTLRDVLLDNLQSGALSRRALLDVVPGKAAAALRAALKDNLIEITHDISYSTLPARALPLNAAQCNAVDSITTGFGRYAPYLLFGVTGSGKTEVYLELIARCLQQGRQALLLLPEIGLTPQILERVKNHFPSARICSLHSSVAEGERARGFVAAWQGQVEIVIGTRLAVFVPMPRLGLIVIDEEHDASYKQQDGLSYSARDLAVWRAHQQTCPIVLGSATPSLETWLRAQKQRYVRLDLPTPAVASTPARIRLIDTRRLKLDQGLSRPLLDALQACLARGEQSLVFLNRRGYAPVVSCSACGWVSQCLHCEANMVFHASDRCLRCHHCGAHSSVPRACPDCGNQDIRAFGRGTQRLEERLIEYFPQARILRVDRDAVRTPKAWEEIRAQIARAEIDILIGTQMLAKGHDFPRLTTVGIVGADASLFSADYRAPERLFAQLMQVAGRGGRGELPGEVLVQTEFADHMLYKYLVQRDFEGFARWQLEDRKKAIFPPYSFQAVVRAEAPSLSTALEFLNKIRNNAPLVEEVRIYDAVPMQLMRKANLERAQLMIEADVRPLLQNFMSAFVAQLYTVKTPRDLRWRVEIDPWEI